MSEYQHDRYLKIPLYKQIEKINEHFPFVIFSFTVIMEIMMVINMMKMEQNQISDQ